MKLKDSFILQKADDQQFLISTDSKLFSGVIKSNETASFIIKLLEKDISKEEILCEMKKQFCGDEKLMMDDIDKIINTLKKIGAIDE